MPSRRINGFEDLTFYTYASQRICCCRNDVDQVSPVLSKGRPVTALYSRWDEPSAVVLGADED